MNLGDRVKVLIKVPDFRDREGTIVYMGRSATELSGLDPEQWRSDEDVQEIIRAPITRHHPVKVDVPSRAAWVETYGPIIVRVDRRNYKTGKPCLPRFIHVTPDQIESASEASEPNREKT